MAPDDWLWRLALATSAELAAAAALMATSGGMESTIRLAASA